MNVSTYGAMKKYVDYLISTLGGEGSIYSPEILTGSTSDNAPAINAALQAAGGTYTWPRTSGGRPILLPDGDIYIKAPLVITRKSGIIGQTGTRIIAASDFVGDKLIELQDYPADTRSNVADQFLLYNFILDGNRIERGTTITSYSTGSGADAGKLRISKNNHGLANGTEINIPYLWPNVPPSCIGNYYTYFVVGATTNYFNVSRTSGGTAIAVIGSDLGSGDGSAKYVVKAFDGMYLDTTGGYYDHVVDNLGVISCVKIENCSRHGIYSPSTIATVYFIDKLEIVWNGGDGLHLISTDNYIFEVNACGNGRGIVLNGANNMMNNTKVYYNEQCGLYVGPSGTGNKISNIEMQEEMSTGLYLDECNNVEVTNMVIESAGHTGTTPLLGRTYDGIGVVLDCCKNCKVKGNVGNRPFLAGDIQYATKWINDAGLHLVGNEVDITVTDTSNERPIPYLYDVMPPITNRLRVNGVDRHLPNILEAASAVSTDTDASGIVDGWSIAAQGSGSTITNSIDATYNCQKINVTNNVNITKKVTAYFEIPAVAGDIISFAVEGMAERGLSFQAQINANAGLPISGAGPTYVDNSSGSTIKYSSILTACATTTNSTTVNVASTANIKVGDVVDIRATATGAAITNGTGVTVLTVPTDTTFTVAAAVTTSSSHSVYINGTHLGTSWSWSVVDKFTLPATTTFVRCQVVILTEIADTQDKDCYLRNIIVTKTSQRNKSMVMKWGATPSGDFVPMHFGHMYLDTANNKVYFGNGVANSSWLALN